MSTSNNPNLPAVRRAATRYGATITRVIHGRHVTVDLLTHDGRLVRVHVNKSKTDPFKLEGWVRQKLNQGQRPETVRRDK